MNSYNENNSELEVFVIRTSNFNIINYNYLIFDRNTKESALIDPSWNYQIINLALKNIGGNLKAVFLTHSHIDHTNLAEKFAKEYDAKVYMNKIEIQDYNFSCKNLVPLNDGNIIKIADQEVLCIHTPGHTSGSMCYLTGKNFFSGDTVFIEGCGICTGPGASPEDMYDSITKINGILKDDYKVFPAHCYGKAVGCNAGYVKKSNIYFNLNKENFIDFRMRKNQKGLFNFK